MSNVNAKPTWIDVGNLTIKRTNLHGWARESPNKIKLFLHFENYGLHTEYVKGDPDGIDEMEKDLDELRENNML